MTITIITSLFLAAVCAVSLGILSYRDHETTIRKAMKEHDQKNDLYYSFENLPNNPGEHSTLSKVACKAYNNNAMDSLFYSTGR